MKTAALYCCGRVVIARSHLEAYEQLSEDEKNGHITSGFFDTETREFLSDLAKEHFYNKKILMIRHGKANNNDWIDPELCSEGYTEAYNLSKYLSQFDLSNFRGFTSPLLRCLQTACVVSQITNIKFQINPDIMETLPNVNDIIVRNHHKDFPDFDWPTYNDFEVKCESKKEFLERTGSVLSQLPDKSILITHCGVVSSMARLALCDEKIGGVPTASVTYIDNQEIKCLGKTFHEMHNEN